MGVGAKTKLTTGRQRTICDALRKGNTRTCAANLAGITRETFYQWLEGNLAFSDAVTRAEAEAEDRYVEAVDKASDADWRAAAFWLERRRHGEWMKREEQQHTGRGGGKIIVEYINATPGGIEDTVTDASRGAEEDTL
jgi:hypothetical protein